MSTDTATPLMTVEELLALPDNGMDRDLILGQLRERPMTRRNRRHAGTLIKLGKILDLWLDRQPEPRGQVLGGDAAFLISRNPDTTVGIDIAFVSSELAKQTPPDVFLIEGAPLLAVEILSPSDTHEDVVSKIELYLEAGVEVVWIVDPDLRTVTIYRPDGQSAFFNAAQELTCEPKLPGLRINVADLFVE